MSSFEIREDFYLNGEKTKIIAGGLHYFRVVPEYWRDRLEKIKALGCNTVETYVAWNMHEAKKGRFDFTGMRDLKKFLETAAELGLYAIVRPSPYICAEWEMGGLPAWLLAEEGMRFRSSYKPFLDAVDNYYKELFKILTPLQITKGGPIIMFQIENEYGAYGEDTEYLKSIRDMMVKYGAEVPMFTSDGPWGDYLACGGIPGVLQTANFGSKGHEQFKILKKRIGENKPLMCTEFWVGWFDAWGDEKHNTGDIAEHVKDLDEILSDGSVSIYMAHGGTNFGFMNGSNYFAKLTPDTTSYDYDAPLSEDGKITEKYRVFQDIIRKYRDFEEIPLSTKIEQKAYGVVKAQKVVKLFDILDTLADSKHFSGEKLPGMEACGQDYGYILYKTKAATASSVLKIEDGQDRIHEFKNGELMTILFDKETSKALDLSLAAGDELTLLAENLGRVNFASKIPFQRKGIRGKVLADEKALTDWTYYNLNLDKAQLAKIDWTKAEDGIAGMDKAATPTFSRFSLVVDKACDTYLDFTGWGKGCIFLNGFNLGRFWEIGPQKRLYVPAPLLKEGENEIIIFETDGKRADSIEFFAEHKLY